MAKVAKRGGAVKVRYLRKWTLAGRRWHAHVYCPENGEILAWTEAYAKRIDAAHAIDRLRRQLPVADEEIHREIAL